MATPYKLNFPDVTDPNFDPDVPFEADNGHQLQVERQRLGSCLWRWYGHRWLPAEARSHR